jgi:hypothetical protein
MDGNDVRVREARGHPRLAEKSLFRRRTRREMRWKDLDGHVAVELHFASEVYHTHAAPAELVLDRVFPGEGGLESEEVGGRLGHE